MTFKYFNFSTFRLTVVLKGFDDEKHCFSHEKEHWFPTFFSLDCFEPSNWQNSFKLCLKKMKKLYKLEVFELFAIFGVTFKHIWIKNCFVSSKRLLDNEFSCCWTDLEFNPWKLWNIYRKWFRKLRNKGFFDICVIVVIFLQNCSIFPEQRYYTTKLPVVERIQPFDLWKLLTIWQM